LSKGSSDDAQDRLGGSTHGVLLHGVRRTGTAASFSNTTAITIPAGAPTTTLGPAAPYPSPINVAGLTGTITKLTVGINAFSHTVPADVGVC